ncbi:MAG: hypothetical protein WCC90_04845 [Methylocella sp.]
MKAASGDGSQILLPQGWLRLRVQHSRGDKRALVIEVAAYHGGPAD